MSAQHRATVGVIGLGSMGLGMALHLVSKGYRVKGYDINPESRAKFTNSGGYACMSPAAAAKDVENLIVMVVNDEQVQQVLLDADKGVMKSVGNGATIYICSTVPPAFMLELQDQFNNLGRNDVILVDAPVSGGTMRAANGCLTILASGPMKTSKQVLEELSERLYIIEGGVGQASKVKAVNQLLAGVHIVAATEAIGLAARAGLDTREVYEIIVNAAGNSWMFENRLPHILDDDKTCHSAIDIMVKDMGIVTGIAKSCNFPVPLASNAQQLYISASNQGWGRDDDSRMVRLYLGQTPELVHKLVSNTNPMSAITPSTTPTQIHKIGFIGLGAMGFGQAKSLCAAGYSVSGFDVWKPSIKRFVDSVEDRASAAHTAAEVSRDAQVLVIMVQNAAQVMTALFGQDGALEALPSNSVIILNSTVPPDFVRQLETRISEVGRDIDLVDAPVSGGVARAASGTLTIISSGSERALSKARPALVAMSGPSSNLYTVQGGVGAGSSIKMVNQMLAGVHIAAAAEAMAFGARIGLDTGLLYEIVKNAAGGSWMFENRVPAMLKADWTPNSALAIFLKDLGIVLDEAKRLHYPAHMTQAAFQVYQLGAAMSKEADSGVVRVWEKMTGVSVSESNKTFGRNDSIPQTLPLNLTLKKLPPPYAGNVVANIQKRVASPATPVLVILDDDPTGTQTVHDIEVTSVYDKETLLSLFNTSAKGWFILTNSRALEPSEARKLISAIVRNVQCAAKEAGKTFEIVLRGDSTLRGHFPDEPEAVEEVLGKADAWILAPFFYQGGRYTINDIHYVAEGDSLVPAGLTPFAKDASFGYSPVASHLKQYILEKAPGKFTNDQILSITIDDIRVGGPAKVAEKLLSFPKGCIIIVNAQIESDMNVFSSGLLTAEEDGRKFLFRTAAAFVSSRLGIESISPLSSKDLDLPACSNGGLIIAGSYVPKTTAQLAHLRSRRGVHLHVIEVEVQDLLDNVSISGSTSTKIADNIASEASVKLQEGIDVLIMTSRSLITGSSASSSLKIGSVIAQSLVDILKNITIRPRYLIAKGGITSSDAASKGLGMKRALVVGQAAPGVPLWRCWEDTVKWKGIPYVVFPGNVGGEEALGELVERWAL